MSVPKNRVLPSKESSLFKELLTLYETRQLKKGQKTADLILKKFPEHGETLCMKGLVLTHMGKREEGTELVKKGIRYDLTSHICWHVFGLIQKGEKKYEEALKSYTQALKFDKENINILRDAAQLQTQLRAFDALVETRHTILRLRPNTRSHWMGLAVAYYLSGNLLEAKKVLEEYGGMLKNVPNYDVEHSEAMLFQIRLLEDLGEAEEALNLLDTNAKSRGIVDRIAIMEIRARLLSKSGSEDATNAWKTLIDQNPDSYIYFRGFLSHQGLDLDSSDPQQQSTALAILQDFSKQIPKASAPRRLALTLAHGDTFKELVEAYIMTALTKGIPSLFADIKPLYRDPSKQQAIRDIVESIRKKYSPLPDVKSSSVDEPPTTYLWALYFLAQHYSFISQQPSAISILDIAIQHTPTLPELHTCKARALKRAGDPFGAARCLDDARTLDGQDRFLNTKCGKYRLRAGMVDEAVEVFGLFTKKDAASPGADLEDMQSYLYMIEEGDAHHRNGKYGPALKRYTAVQKVFDEVEDDQYDFHGYCLRKSTVNVYLSMLDWEDKVRSHQAYIRAALQASRIYVALHDDPSLATSTSTSNLSAEEKKAKKKAKKAAQKVQEETKKPTTAAVEDKGLEVVPPKDDDPEGHKLLTATDPLERANKWLAPLTSLPHKNIEVWIQIYDVAIRRKKYLQAIQALTNAKALEPEHPELHVRLIHFKKDCECYVIGANFGQPTPMPASTWPQPPPAPIGPLLDEFISTTYSMDVSLETFNSQYLQRHSNSALGALAASKASHVIGAPIEEVEAGLFTTLGKEVDLNVKSALTVLNFLKSLKAPRTDEYRTACDGKFELSTVFKTPEEIASLQKVSDTGEEVATTNGTDTDVDKGGVA